MNETSASRGIKIREKILAAIISYIEQHGYPPTVREISDMVGLKSTSSTQSHLKKMEIEGMIETDAPDSSPRAIRVPGYKFVNQYNAGTDDMCEWKWGIDYAKVQCKGDKILFDSRRLFTYCPYCGKKIKVVE